jgi:hypothetical protein
MWQCIPNSRDPVTQRIAVMGANWIGLIDVRQHVSIRVGLPVHAFQVRDELFAAGIDS